MDIGTIILLVLVFSLFGSIAFNIIKSFDGVFGPLWLTFSGVILFIFLFCIPISQLEGHRNIVKFKSVEQDIQKARFKAYNTDYTKIETITIVTDIIKYNAWLAGAKFNNEKFDLWTPDEVEELKPLQ